MATSDRASRRGTRAGGLGAPVLAVALLVLGAMVVGPVASAARATAATRVIDVARVRLTVPAAWQVTLVTSCSSSGCHVPSLPGGDATIDLALVRPLPCARGAGAHVRSVWVSRISRRPGAPRTETTLACAATGVAVHVPSLGVVVYGFGRQGIAAAESARPSGLEDLLAAHLVTSHPRGWTAVRWRGVEVFAPPAWPRIHLTLRGRYAAPGACGFNEFPRPAAYVGVSGAVLQCPLITEDSLASGSAATGNGVWLGGVEPAGVLPPLPRGPRTTVRRVVDGVVATLSIPVALWGSGSASLTVRAADVAPVGITLGFGANPGVAIRILDSVRRA